MRTTKNRFWIWLACVSFTIVCSQCIEKLRCTRYHEYLNHEANGHVIRKYIDKANHARETVELKLLGSNSKEVEVTLFSNGLYDSLQIGDLVSKNKGSSTTTVIRKGQEMKFEVKESDYCGE